MGEPHRTLATYPQRILKCTTILTAIAPPPGPPYLKRSLGLFLVMAHRCHSTVRAD